jgi:1-deoxy-D-xylulose-5-phosphate reductoisomerase
VFRCIDLAYQAGISGGSAPAWLSAANEVAVDAFLNGAMAWSGIADVVEETLEGWRDEPVEQVESVLEADEEARVRARAVVGRRIGEGGSG